MSGFFVNSSEILTISLLNCKTFNFNQAEMGRCLGCSQSNISYIISSLLQKGIAENIKGFIMINQYKLIEELADYTEIVYNADVSLINNLLTIKDWTPEINAFLQSYLRIFNIDYMFSECQELNEIYFVFSANVYDIADID